VREGIEDRLCRAVAGTPLAKRLPAAVAPLLERRGDHPALRDLDGAPLRGLARAAAAWPETAVFLSRRTALLERLARADAGSLARRTRELETWRPAVEPGDLEGALDALRLLRREESCLAGCLHHAGLALFPEVSEFLSVLAETIVREALELARRSAPGLEFAVVGMGKIAGREFTYHSDLDLIFLYAGGAEQVDAASRVGQRLVSYLTTMTPAGVAYAVDTRLRPSGGQGMLVTSLPAFERYQCEQAQTWEHVAMLRARPIAGSIAAAAATLARVRERVRLRHAPPWPELAEIRTRVEVERGSAAGGVPFKTGVGGLMDVDFLAGGGLLERAAALPTLPGVPALLRAAVRGPRVEAVLAGYELVRRVEASARWIAGRPVERLPTDPTALALVAELAEPGLAGDALLDRIDGVRARVRGAYADVISAGTIAALER
jgi:glutamate-ammonia-ligase adenylyltransferase